ncbi:thiopeptide-type bacteriocin biosynthesis protein [Niabella sp. W65]|nr:thiopeptide-type bacteriocin biosynthesis protein [Niabella sp. W65]MCH7364076.1 thiopeptide-type bacteriocin biosynthesis protein [Niabella sp. W65]ULT46485.1 thiopeptide-type bacteriocin biosynthesis protein [Niabella sp. I65]
MLVDNIGEWLKAHHNLIYQWFFIRFNEGGDHVRLRVKMKDPVNMYILLNSLTTTLKDEICNGIISDIQVKTYQPEWERYGVEMMEPVEVHFCTDSRYVLELVSLTLSDEVKYRLCANLLNQIRLSDIFSFDEFDAWLKDTTERWEQEHQLQVPGFKKLNQHYKAFQTTSVPRLSEATLNSQNEFIRSLLNTLQQAGPAARLSLLGSLVHMHVNRLFNYHQRTHELIVYYFFSKETASAMRAVKTPLLHPFIVTNLFSS